jgi:zinc transporter ZupT
MSANTALRFVCALIAVAIPTFAMLALIVTVANPPPRVNVLLAFIAAGVVVYLGWAER